MLETTPNFAAGELKREEACGDPTSRKPQNNYNSPELGFVSITRAQLPSYSEYRTDRRRLTNKKFRSLSPPLFVLLNSAPIQHLGPNNYDSL
jgi:hypothetical protein